MRAAMARLQELRGQAIIRSSMRALDLLSRVSLLVAICLGIYSRWEISQEANMLIIFVLALVVLGLAIVLHCYFHMEKVSQSLIHLWRGSLLGLLCFVGSPALDHGVKEQTTNYLLLTSMVLRTLWALLERICGCAKYRPAFLTTAERMELVGFGIVSFVVSSSPSVAVFVGALAVLMVVLRVKAVLTIPNLVGFAFFGEFLLIKGLDVSTNTILCIPGPLTLRDIVCQTDTRKGSNNQLRQLIFVKLLAHKKRQESNDPNTGVAVV